MLQFIKLYGTDRMISERVYSDAVVAQLNVIAWHFSEGGPKKQFNSKVRTVSLQDILIHKSDNHMLVISGPMKH